MLLCVQGRQNIISWSLRGWKWPELFTSGVNHRFPVCGVESWLVKADNNLTTTTEKVSTFIELRMT